MTHTIVSAQDLLRRYSIRSTNQRVDILEILQNARVPLTLKDIMKKSGKKAMHEVTAYRVLTLFCENGIVKQIDFRDSIPYFELVDTKHDHHHIICTECKKISDFVGCGVDVISRKALAQSKDFIHITGHSFEFFGLCKKCA